MKKMEAVVGRLPYAIVLLLLKLSWSKLVANSILMKENFQWNAATENAKKSIIAKGFKLYYYGSDRFFVHGAWAGTIIALNAQLVLGQTHNKELYGQFYGRGVVVYQYSKVYRVPFNPQKSTTFNTQLDVAWLGVLK